MQNIASAFWGGYICCGKNYQFFGFKEVRIKTMLGYLQIQYVIIIKIVH